MSPSTGEPIGEPKDDGGKDEEGEEGSDDERQALFPSSSAAEARRLSRLVDAIVRSGDRRFGFASMPASCSSSSLPSTATRSPGSTGWSRPGTLGHLGPVSRHDRHRGQVAEMSPEGRVVGALGLLHVQLDHGEMHAPQLDAVVGLRRRHISTKEGPASAATSRTLPLPRDPLEGSGDGGVRQLGHDADVGAELADAQGGLQGVNLLRLGADTAAAWARPASTRASPR